MGKKSIAKKRGENKSRTVLSNCRNAKASAAKMSAMPEKKRIKEERPAKKSMENKKADSIQPSYSSNSRPLGVRVLVNFSLILAAFYFLSAYFSDTGMFFWITIRGSSVFFVNIAMTFFVLASAYGIWKRRRWSYYLAQTLYALSILNSFVSLSAIVVSPSAAIEPVSGMLIPFLISSILLNILTLWYVCMRKGYITGAEEYEEHRVADNIFTSSVYLFYFFMFSVVIIALFSFFVSAKQGIDSIVPEISGKGIPDSVRVCMDKGGEQRDLCILSTVVLHQDDDSAWILCSQIDSDFYRFTCSRVSR